MSSHTFHYCASLEGTATNEEELELNRGSQQLTITNDHNAHPLKFKFDCSGACWMTLKAGESVTFNMQTESIAITGDGNEVPYRIWAFT